jgi:hypothetical protein
MIKELGDHVNCKIGSKLAHQIFYQFKPTFANRLWRTFSAIHRESLSHLFYDVEFE